MIREEKQKAIDAIRISAPIMAMTHEEFDNYIQTLNKVMDWLEQEPCEDCVSRQFMYELGATCIAYRNDKEELIPIISIDSLPPVTPQPKTAHWVKDDFTDLIKCDACGNDAYMDTTSHEQCESYFCPTCGANMRGWKKV